MTRPDNPPLLRFLRAYYAYVFLFDFMLCYAVYTALFQLRGLSVSEIGVLLAFWSASAIVLELPSGALSDHFDRRWLLAAAPLVKALTFVCWGFADGNFWLYGLGFLFWSAGQALYSGTKEALLYERMEAAGRASDYDQAVGRDSAAESIGMVPAH
jgi:MFS family permease